MIKSRILYILAGLSVILFAERGVGAAGLLIADNGNGGILDIAEHAVHVSIHDGVAVTQVTQVFKNTENRQVEALYTFPVPRDASVANFSMWIDGKEMIGEVIEKQRAREIYDSYRRARRDPGLLEQTDYRTFEMRVFPIRPLAEQKVCITYYQPVQIDDDWATYVYPLQSNTRRAVNSRVSGKFSFDLEARSEIPIAQLQSPSHSKHLKVVRHDEHFDEVKIDTDCADLNRDVLVNFRLARPRTGIDMIASRQGGEEGYFCLTLATGQDLPATAQGMDYVFLLDVSGSMNDDSKLDLARSSLDAFIRTLGPGDRFELLAFNAAPAALFGHLMPADDGNLKKGSDFLASREAHGGTLLGPAIVSAYHYAQASRPLNVVILSDGLTEQEERPALTKLIEQRPLNTRVFCIGIGNDIDRDMLQQLADESDGVCAFVSEQADFTRQAEAFHRKLIRPVMTDLKFEFAGIKVYDMESPAPAVLYRGSPRRIYGRYQGSGSARLAFHAKLGDKSIDQTVALEFPKQDDGNPQIERMWAWRKVNRLLNGPDGSRGASIDEVVRLGEAYSIASEYTSLIVLENDAEYARWKIAQRNAFRLTRDREAEQSLTTQLLTLRKTLASTVDSTTAGYPVSALPATSLDPASPAAAVPEANPAPAPLSPHGNSRDLNIGGPGAGAGAIDPLSALLVLLIAGLGLIESNRLRINLLLRRLAAAPTPRLSRDIGRFPVVTLAMALASLAVYAWPIRAAWLEFDKSALADGQFWRTMTCHLTHFSTSHLFWSGSVFVLLGCICEWRDRVRFIACMIVASIAIPLAILVWLPDMRIYRGLSGIDSALFVLAAFLFLRQAGGISSAANWIIWFCVALFCGKILFEMLTMQTVFVQTDSRFVSVPLAHLTGAAIGAVISLWTNVWAAGKILPSTNAVGEAR